VRDKPVPAAKVPASDRFRLKNDDGDFPVNQILSYCNPRSLRTQRFTEVFHGLVVPEVFCAFNVCISDISGKLVAEQACVEVGRFGGVQKFAVLQAH
jgi:hypothetical protein